LASSYRAAPTSSLIGKTAVEQLGTLSLSEKKKRTAHTHQTSFKDVQIYIYSTCSMWRIM
uniref:Integrase n=1 Tax=Ascaris lumbricoides TaxID=6252 RepID=A0A0M3IHX2_ASCLU